MAVRAVNIDEPLAGASHVVLGIGILLSVTDVEFAADRRDAERGVTGRKIRVRKCAGGLWRERESFIQNVDLVVVKIGGIEEICAAVRRQRDAFIDRTVGGSVAD